MLFKFRFFCVWIHLQSKGLFGDRIRFRSNQEWCFSCLETLKHLKTARTLGNHHFSHSGNTQIDLYHSNRNKIT